MFFFEEPEDL